MKETNKMAILLQKKTEVHRVDTEQEAMNMLKEAKDDQLNGGYVVKEGKYTRRTKKSTEEEWYVVTITKEFDV